MYFFAVSMKLGKISVGSVKLPARNALDDLLASTDGGKHDYDWFSSSLNTPTIIFMISSFMATTSIPLLIYVPPFSFFL